MRKGNMLQANKLGPPDSTGTSWPITAEHRVMRGFSLSQGKLLSRVGNAEKGNKWWAWKDSNLRPADYEARLASLELHVNCAV